MDSQRWQRIKKIFDAAIEAEPGQRDAHIAEACAGDEQFREEVIRLLDSFERSEDFIEKTAVAENLSMFDRVTRAISEGDKFGHYRIDRQIGSGGMGEVYLATDEKLGRRVAIKILREEFARHQDNVQRFLREAKAASSLNHPNILVIHEINMVDEANYIVSEYVEGETLRERLRGKPLALTEVLDITIQVAGALDAAHGASIVHRDIKPENIALRPDGYVKVLDFGLAKLVESRQGFLGSEDATRHESQTAQGIIMGTVNYMSPEQAKAVKVDQRTDIFSLGVVLFEMITGATPFRGDSMSETFANLINAEPQPLSRYAPDLPAELERIVARSLRKNLNERYQNMKDLLEDLKGLRKHLEFQSEFHRFKMPPSGGVAYPESATEFFRSEDHPEASAPGKNSIAVLPFANIGGDVENEYFCDGLAEELLNALAKIKGLKVAARTSAFSFKGKNTTVSEIGNALNVRTVLEGSVRRSGNRLRITAKLINAFDGYQLWSERFDGEMKDIFELQDEITLVVIDKLKVDFLSGEKAAVLKRLTDNPEAYEYYLKGIYYRWKLIPEEFRKCLKYFQQAVEADPNFGMAYFGIASYYGYGTAWGLLDMPPQEGWEKAQKAIERSLEADPTLPEIQLTLAAFDLVNHRKFTEAGAAIERAARATPTFAEIHHLYGFYLLTVGRFSEGVREAREALRLDPLSLNHSRFLGISLSFARRFEDSIEQFHQALELEPNNHSVYEVLGEAYLNSGMSDKALGAWRKAAELEGAADIVAVIDDSKGNFDEAIRSVARKKLGRLTERSEAGEFVLAIHYVRAYMMLGDDEQTFMWLEKAVDERNVFPLMMNHDPLYDRLRHDPRFLALMERIGFPATRDLQSVTTNGSEGEPTGEARRETIEVKAAEGSGNLAGPRTKLSSSRIALVAGTLIVLLSLAGVGYYFVTANRSAATANGRKSLAVLPFVNASQDPNAEYLSDGITENIINNLSRIAGLRVMSRNSAFRFKQDQTDVKTIASKLGVDNLVTGDFKQIGDKVVINVHLIDASDESQIWGEQYVKEAGDILAAQNEIAQAVAQNLKVRLTAADTSVLSKGSTANPEAWQLYQRGRFHVFKLTPPEIQTGIGYFQQAIRIDPSYAQAFVGLSEAYRSLVLSAEMPPAEFLEKSNAAARKAVELDDGLSEAHTALGATLFWGWKWDDAEEQFKRAIELNPNSGDARIFYAHLLSNTGRHAEALDEAKRARELDPLFPFINALESQFLAHAGKPDEAITQAKKTFELAPGFWMPHVFASVAYIEKEMYPEAIAEARKARELSPFQTSSVGFEGYALARAGRTAEARGLIEELTKLSATRFVSPTHIAMIYAGLGENDKALDFLEKGFETKDPKMAFLKVDPKWNSLRDDPRFIDLMRRLEF